LTLRYTGSKLVVGTSIESDEYIGGSGYKVHDENGKRLTGWELVGHAAAV